MLALALKGRHGAEAALVSGGTTVPLSRTKMYLFSVAWDQQCKQFTVLTPNQ